MRFLRFLILFSMLAANSLAIAADKNAPLRADKTNDSKTEKAFKPDFAQNLEISYTTNLYRVSPAQTAEIMDVAYSFTDHWLEYYSWGAVLQYSYDKKTPENSEISGLQFMSTQYHVLYLYGNPISFAESISVPVTKAQKNSDEITNVSVVGHIDFAPTADWKISFSLSGRKYFHQYDTSRGGAILTSHTLSESLTVAWESHYPITLSARGVLASAFPYRGDVKHLFGHQETMTYHAHKQMAVYVGHIFGSPVVPLFIPSGEALNVKVTDDFASYITAGLSFTF